MEPAIPPARFARRAGTARVTANANIFEPRLINTAPERGLINLSYCGEAGNVSASGTGSDCWKTLLQIQYSLSVIKSVAVTRSADSGLIWAESNLYAPGEVSPPPSPARFGGWRLSSATTELLMCYNVSAGRGEGGGGGRHPGASPLLLGDARSRWWRNVPPKIVLPLENADSTLCWYVLTSTFF